MPPALSAYFEIVRFGAAGVVLLSHAWPAFFPNHPLPWPGHQAVVVFFVLSGYVISHASESKDKTLRSFVLSRSSRLLCVTIPALALGAAVALSGGSQLKDLILPLFLNFTFFARSWTLSEMAPANDPYWSLCYEVWYYAIFGAAVYMTGLARWLAVTISCLLAGPNILLLMPCWLIGVALHKRVHRFRRHNLQALALFISTAALYLAFFWFDVSIAIRELLGSVSPSLIDNLLGSNQFIGDAILAVIVTANFIAVAKLEHRLSSAIAAVKPIASVFAGTTLSLYLFHYPITIFLQQRHLVGIAPLLAVIAISVALALVTEHKRRWLRSVLDNTFNIPQGALP